MTDVIRITTDRVVSRSKGKVKYYADNGAIESVLSKVVKVYDTQEELDQATQAAIDSQSAEHGAEQAGEAGVNESESEQDGGATDAPASPTKRGRGKKEQVMAKAKTKASKKKAPSKKTAAAAGGPKVRTVAGREHDISNYVRHKNAAGHVSYDNGDTVAEKLRDMELKDVYDFAAKKLDESVPTLKKKYGHLNAGMQRMNLGNRLRKAMGVTASAG